jgi:hypothetical protein
LIYDYYYLRQSLLITAFLTIFWAITTAPLLIVALLGGRLARRFAPALRRTPSGEAGLPVS